MAGSEDGYASDDAKRMCRHFAPEGTCRELCVCRHTCRRHVCQERSSRCRVDGCRCAAFEDNLWDERVGLAEE